VHHLGRPLLPYAHGLLEGKDFLRHARRRVEGRSGFETEPVKRNRRRRKDPGRSLWVKRLHRFTLFSPLSLPLVRLLFSNRCVVLPHFLSPSFTGYPLHSARYHNHAHTHRPLSFLPLLYAIGAFRFRLLDVFIVPSLQNILSPFPSSFPPVRLFTAITHLPTPSLFVHRHIDT